MNLIERLKCPFCNGNTYRSLFKKKYSSKELSDFIFQYYKSKELVKILQNEIYELCECLNCHGIFQKNIPDDSFLNYLYNELISSVESLNKKVDYIKNHERKLNQDFQMITSLFEKKIENIKILEFGCGWGFWSKFMLSKSLNVTTCEFSNVRHQHLIENKIKNFRSLDNLNMKFDFIYSEEVLEHVTSPIDILNQLKNLLSKNGYMFHRFPSSFLFKNKLSKKYIPRKDCAHPLEHINIINKKSFIQMSKNLQINICNPLKFKNQNIFSKLKIIKNNFKFNNILLKN